MDAGNNPVAASILWLLGVGNLGSALAAAMLDSGVVTQDTLTLIERDATRHEALRERFGCRVLSNTPVGERLEAGSIALLAVKPQDAEPACTLLKPHLSETSIVLSVLAGVRSGKVATLLGVTGRVVRCMPNLGAVVRESATGYFAPPEMSPAELECIHRVVSSFGRAWQVSDESLIDAVTAVSGSGPAYVCWLGEQMSHVAIELGIDPTTARELVLQTIIGTAQYLSREPIAFSELRARVTSPKGTTAAAIETLSNAGAEDVMQAAVRAAFARAVELSR